MIKNKNLTIFLEQIPANSRVSIFPATKLSIQLYKYINENRPEITVSYFMDSFQKGFAGKVEIISPEQSVNNDKVVDFVIIAAYAHQEELELTCKKIGINNYIKIDKNIYDFFNGLVVENIDLYTEQREMFPSGHYHSVHPSDEDIKEGLLKNTDNAYQTEGIDVNLPKQLENLEFFRQYVEKIDFPASKQSDKIYYINNSWFNAGESFVLASMILKNKPKQIIEIGSGFSTSVMCDINRDFLNSSIKLMCIDPNPERLKELLGEAVNEIELYPQKLQDVDIEMFSSLQENDILFVDSSHVAKINSDVLKVFYNILPLLNRGVIIHFHDIPKNFEYSENWLKKGVYWNEAYFLKAFLQYNEKFKIEFYNDFMSDYIGHADIEFPRSVGGGSIYLRKL